MLFHKLLEALRNVPQMIMTFVLFILWTWAGDDEPVK